MENLLEIIDNVFSTNKSYNEILEMTRDIKITLGVTKEDLINIDKTLDRINKSFDNVEKTYEDFNVFNIEQENRIRKMKVGVAQMVERCAEDAEVVGSLPTSHTSILRLSETGLR